MRLRTCIPLALKNHWENLYLFSRKRIRKGKVGFIALVALTDENEPPVTETARWIRTIQQAQTGKFPIQTKGLPKTWVFFLTVAEPHSLGSVTRTFVTWVGTILVAKKNESSDFCWANPFRKRVEPAHRFLEDHFP